MSRAAKSGKASSAGPASVAKPRVAAHPGVWESEDWQEEVGAPGEWSSLLGDLTDAGARRAKWRVHDRTHLELAVEYPLTEGEPKPTYVWEAFFFIPRSLRVNAESYSKDDIHRDLQSYIRFAVPPLSLEELAEIPAERLGPALASGSDAAVRELRLFACHVRASAISARRTIRKMAESEDRTGVEMAVRALLVRLERVLEAFRAELPAAAKCSRATRITARWVDEDVSRVVETVLATLSMRLRSAGFEAAAKLLAGGAVAEAGYRKQHGLGGVGHGGADKRDVESLEFRRHLLKRFTSSVLWLRRDISEGGRWTLNVLYAIAACVAMAFALVAAFYHGPDFRALGDLWTWAVVVMLAYAGKDRIKATLQGIFSKWVSRRFPDRRWRLTDRGEGQHIGTVAERSAFMDHTMLPPAVRVIRNSTREHDLEEHARPERVLWHQKVCTLRSGVARTVDPRFSSVTEIFRLDLRKWLVHTDDPKQRIYFADPESQHVYSAMAPRVYNLGIVYRVRPKDQPDAPWRRVRVVVGRKGIKRIEQVEGA